MESENARESCQRCTKLLPEGLPAFIADGQIVCRDCNDAAHRTCPNCATKMERKLPASRGKCPKCGEAFYICREQKLFPTTILSLEQKDSLARLRDFHWFTTYGLTWRDREAAVVRARIEGGGIAKVFEVLNEQAARSIAEAEPGSWEVLSTPGILAAESAARQLAVAEGAWMYPAPPLTEALRTAVAMARASGSQPSAIDIARRMIEDAILQRSDSSGRRSLYQLLARILAVNDHDYIEAAKNAIREEARECALLGLDKAKVDAAGHGCAAGERAAAREYNIKEVIVDPPIPCADCSNEPLGLGSRPWCTCAVIFEASEDSDGR